MKALEQILYWASVNYHPLYEQYLVEAYEKEHGPHFNEERARKVVDEMYHYDGEGEKVAGEAWTIEEASHAADPFWSDLDKCVTDWDIYVALNMWQHDLGCNYESRSENPKKDIAEDAITWAFLDDDAQDGKLWRYFCSQMG